jgi:ectoine hydroxylase-related dioxygenase (phytanoyl-CoA dioxygenase family)
MAGHLGKAFEMVVESLSMPDAKDLDVLSINPKAELQICNHLLDDHEALMRFHDEEGYILIRGALDPDSVKEARQAMFAIMERHGLIEPGTTEPVWTGKPFAGGMEESPEFAGISRRLVEHPTNLKVMEKILGEPAIMLPIAQYRTYPPGGSITGVHQDGFFSPGIKKYKPVWMPMVDCPREMGGLMVAVRQCNRGFFHNIAKTPSHIPEGVIPDEAWATIDYQAGDILILNPCSPHASMPNTSNKCRVTIDTRVQSASEPCVLMATIVEASIDSICVALEDGSQRSFRVDGNTFSRIEHPGIRQTPEEYLASATPGKSIVVVFDGDHAETLRRASAN